MNGWINLQVKMLRGLDALAERLGRGAKEHRNLVTGARGERAGAVDGGG